jgi:hypothetical protein
VALQGYRSSRGALHALAEARKALDALRRAGDPKAGCLATCASWSEDYRSDGCDCGYVDACDSPSDYAANVLVLLDELESSEEG